MPSVTLTILGDASGARRALQETRAEYERSAAVIGGGGRQVSAERRRAENEEIQGARRQLRVLNDARVRDRLGRKRADDAAASQRRRDRRREENEEIQGTRRQLKALTTARQKAARDQKKIGDDAVRDANRAEQRKTQNAEREEKRRTRLAETEVRRRQRTEEALERRVQGRQFRQGIGQQRRGEREVASRYQRGGRMVGSGIQAVGGAAVGVATDIHGQIQDARRRRAVADRALGNTMRNAGMSRAETTSTRARAHRLVRQTGIDYADVVEALRVGQERGSALEPERGQSREAALESAIETIRDANAEGVNPGQLLAARGRLRAAGLSGAALDTAQRFTIGAAQRGSVEVDQIIQQGLPGATQLMQQRVSALGVGASPEAQQAARLRAFEESVALQEVAARSGRAPGNTANTLSSLQNFLSTPRRQEMMLNNIRQAEERVNTSTPEGRAQAARFRALRTTMFERDPTRTGNAMRMRAEFVNNPLDVASGLAAATGGNANQAANILTGGGHGNSQSFLSNQRQMFAFLGSDGQSVRDMMKAGGISRAQINAHRTEVEGDDLANLNRNEEARDTALLDNTGAIRALSDRFTEWQQNNPVLSSTGGGALGLLGGLTGALLPYLGTKVAARLGIGAVNAAATTAATAGTTAATVGTGTVLAGVVGGAALSGLLGTSGVINGENLRNERLSTGERVGRGVLGALFAPAVGAIGAYDSARAAFAPGAQLPAAAQATQSMSQEQAAFLGQVIERGFTAALANTPLTATIDPHTAAHATSQAAGSRGGPAARR